VTINNNAGVAVTALLTKMALPTVNPLLWGLYGVSFAYFAFSSVSRYYGLDKIGNSDCDTKISRYNKLYTEKANEGTAKERKSVAASMTKDYYDLATDFYEYGWGHCFHFGVRFAGEGFHESLRRHEYWLANRAGIKKGETWLDVGAGVGGPMRGIARFTEANILGINYSAYQIVRGDIHNKRAGLDHLCSFIECDFMKLPTKLERNKYDGAYAIEATCHAADKVGCYKSVFEVLKPGAAFVVYEWCVTDKYDANNAEHRRIKKGIEEGDSLPDMVHTSEVVKAFKEAGFVVEEAFDRIPMTPFNSVPWYTTIGSGWSPSNWKSSVIGRTLTHAMIICMETVGIAPKGSAKTHTMLCGALEPLATGGQMGIFTPAFYCKGRKPLK